MDYRKYRAGFVEKLACAAVGAGAAGMAAWLLYRSVWGMLLFPAAYLVCVKKYCTLQKEKRKEQLLMEFKDAMQSASAALLAGYSVENAWRETEKELLELHGEKGFMAAEVRWMNEGVRMNEPLERLLLSFAARSGCEEIESFAEVFAFAKRSGGDFVHIMQTTVQKLAGRIEVEREVATVLAGKRLEGRIMEIMPLAILAYLQVASGEFLDALYGSAFGVAVMSIAFCCYLAAIKWSEHILDIQI